MTNTEVAAPITMTKAVASQATAIRPESELRRDMRFRPPYRTSNFHLPYKNHDLQAILRIAPSRSHTDSQSHRLAVTQTRCRTKYWIRCVLNHFARFTFWPDPYCFWFRDRRFLSPPLSRKSETILMLKFSWIQSLWKTLHPQSRHHFRRHRSRPTIEVMESR